MLLKYWQRLLIIEDRIKKTEKEDNRRYEINPEIHPEFYIFYPYDDTCDRSTLRQNILFSFSGYPGRNSGLYNHFCISESHKGQVE